MAGSLQARLDRLETKLAAYGQQGLRAVPTAWIARDAQGQFVGPPADAPAPAVRTYHYLQQMDSLIPCKKFKP